VGPGKFVSEYHWLKIRPEPKQAQEGIQSWKPQNSSAMTELEAEDGDIGGRPWVHEPCAPSDGGCLVQ
jgi:hypothetical protein